MSDYYEHEIARLRSEIHELSQLGSSISSAQGRCSELNNRLSPVAANAHYAIGGGFSAQQQQMISGITEASSKLRTTQERLADSAQSVRSEINNLEAEIHRLRQLQREEAARRAAQRR